MGKPIDKKEEKELLDLLGDIAAGECPAVLIVAEKVSTAGELSLVVRYGGVDGDGARRLAANGLWSGQLTQSKLKDAQKGDRP
jgi:hypothetical protein